MLVLHARSTTWLVTRDDHDAAAWLAARGAKVGSPLVAARWRHCRVNNDKGGDRDLPANDVDFARHFWHRHRREHSFIQYSARYSYHCRLDEGVSVHSLEQESEKHEQVESRMQ